MLVADGAVSASDGALDVAEGGVDPLEGRVQGALRPEGAIFRLRSAAPWTSFNGDPAPSPIRWALGRGLVRMHPIRSFAVARMAGIGRLRRLGRGPGNLGYCHELGVTGEPGEVCCGLL